MKLHLGADHAGFELKEKVKAVLLADGYEVHDHGNSVYDKADDYPDFIRPVAEAVSKNPDISRGIIFGWSGQGEAIAANRHPHVRAAVYVSGGDEIIRLSRQHNNANVLSFGSHFVTDEEAIRLTRLWLDTPFSNEERHVRRIAKLG